jgi:DNA-binding NarL/FixJ family response regulator
MKVIIHTGSMHFNKLIHAIKYGAKGYITKSESLNEVLEAILNAIQGGPFYAKKMEKIYKVQLEKFYKDNSIDCIYDLLTEHEKNILTEYSSGNDRQKIADKLNMKIGTFNVHISNIVKKLNVTTEAGLIKFCLENNFHH